MNIINNYLNFLNEQSGWLNFQEDRYNIMNTFKAGMISCTRNGLVGIPQRINLMQCQINVTSQAIQSIEMAKQKCMETPNSDKCMQMYDTIQGSLQQKLQFYQYELLNLQRKGGVSQNQYQQNHY